MSVISDLLNQIKTAVYGKDVRQAIHDAIQQCYLDSAEGITPVITTETVSGGHNINITVGADTTTVFVANGQNGQNGTNGTNGTNGQDGTNGVGSLPDGTYTAQEIHTSGTLTSNGTYVIFFIPFVDAVNRTITITPTKISVRDRGNYLANSLTTDVTYQYVLDATGIIVKAIKSDGWGGENNSIVSVQFVFDLTVEGSAQDISESLAQIQTNKEDIDTLKADLEDLDERVEALESGSGGSGLTDAVKTALMDLVSHIGVWTDDSGQDYIDNLYDALYPAVPPADIVSISAVYTQSGTVYDTDTLNSLKDDLVITATLSDQTTQTVTGYTLSGTLTVGTSTITVYYGGKTTTFNVTVSEKQKTYLYNWDLTESLTDTVSEQTITLNCASGKSNAVQDENGLTFNDATQNAYLGTIDMVGKTIEIDVESMLFKGNTSHHIRFLMNAQYTNSTGYGLGSLVWKSGLGWASYGWTSETGSTRAWSANTWGESLTGTTSEIINALSGKTVKVVYGSDGHTQKLYLDDVLIGTLTDIWFNTTGTTHYSNKIFIGGVNSVNKDQGDQCYDMTITGIRIYENEVA